MFISDIVSCCCSAYKNNWVSFVWKKQSFIYIFYGISLEIVFSGQQDKNKSSIFVLIATELFFFLMGQFLFNKLFN